MQFTGNAQSHSHMLLIIACGYCISTLIFLSPKGQNGTNGLNGAPGVPGSKVRIKKYPYGNFTGLFPVTSRDYLAWMDYLVHLDQLA